MRSKRYGMVNLLQSIRNATYDANREFRKKFVTRAPGNGPAWASPFRFSHSIDQSKACLMPHSRNALDIVHQLNA
jgi:hypothetical protein